MTSKACCSRKPNLDVSYTPQGQTETIAGLDAYVIHPEGTTPKIGILVAYDAFGATKLGHLGCDLLSSHLNAVVVEPDFFEGDYADQTWFPPNEETKDAFAAWRKKKFDVGFDGYLERGSQVASEAKKKFGIDSWGIVGFCWGGKFSVLASKEGTPYKASVQVHPGRMDVADAEALTIPHRLMASKDEPTDVIEQYEKYFKDHPEKKGESETYKTQHHGWAAARANLDDAENKKEFERAYNEMAEFFKKHL